MLFLVFLLTLERAGGTKLRAGGMGQEEKPTGGERREVTRMEGKKKIAAQVHDSFNSKMQRQIKYLKVLYVVTSVSSTTAQ